MRRRVADKGAYPLDYVFKHLEVGVSKKLSCHYKNQNANDRPNRQN